MGRIRYQRAELLDSRNADGGFSVDLLERLNFRLAFIYQNVDDCDLNRLGHARVAPRLRVYLGEDASRDESRAFGGSVGSRKFPVKGRLLGDVGNRRRP